MRKYRKLPVVIEAVQFTGDVAAPEIAALQLGHAFDPRRGCEVLTVPTTEGIMMAKPGDWIIRGVEGEVYPCSDSVFRKTHQPAEGCGCGRADCYWCQR